MKIAFLLISADNHLRRHFALSKVAMVPREIRNRYGTDYRFSTNPPHLSFDRYVNKFHSENPEYSLVLLTDQEMRPELPNFGLPLSVLDTGTRGIPLELSRVLTFWIKRLNAISQIFRPLGNQKALLLPFRNFSDIRAQALWSSITDNLSERTFGLAVEIEKLVSHMKSREFPKRRGNYRDKYFIDDRGYHFQYGHEKHSQPVINGDGHNTECAISSRIRLGVPYDHERHFNLSLEDNSDLGGHSFTNCHGAEQTAGSCNHLNIFPNSFIN